MFQRVIRPPEYNTIQVKYSFVYQDLIMPLNYKFIVKKEL